jgi:membrane associated rhomboid family serine protease
MSEFRYTRPTSFPPIVKNLIIINVLVWVAQKFFDGQYQLTDKIGLWPIQSPHFKPYQIATHMFAHSPDMFAHILFNMFGLWMFGRVLENVWGGKRFLFFYLICGVGAAIAHLAVEYFQYQPVIDLAHQYEAQGYHDMAVRLLDVPVYAVGASGAIMGVLVAFAFLFPNTELFIMLIPIPIKAKWAVLGFVAIDLFSGISRISGDNVAHFAHLGGAITGFFIVLYWNKTNRKTLY